MATHTKKSKTEVTCSGAGNLVFRRRRTRDATENQSMQDFWPRRSSGPPSDQPASPPSRRQSPLIKNACFLWEFCAPDRFDEPTSDQRKCWKNTGDATKSEQMRKVYFLSFVLFLLAPDSILYASDTEGRYPKIEANLGKTLATQQRRNKF